MPIPWSNPQSVLFLTEWVWREVQESMFKEVSSRSVLQMVYSKGRRRATRRWCHKTRKRKVSRGRSGDM